MKTTSYTKKTFEMFDQSHIVVYFNETAKQVPAMQAGDEQAQEQTAYEYDTVLANGTEPSVELFKTALMAEGFGDFKAEAVAAEVMLKSVQSGEAVGDELALAKQMMTARIGDYDSSTAVNEFFINGESHWIPREYREMFEERLAQERRREHTTVSLDLPDAKPGDAPLTLNVEVAEVMLENLNDYATDSYDCTQNHKRAVAALATVEDVLGYDYTTGYPKKIDFDQMFES